MSAFGVSNDAGSATPTTVKIGDGTNNAAIKPASTAATTTDSSLVVALSPNTPLPAFTDTTATGTITTTQSVAVACKGMGTVSIQLSGTWTGPCVFEALEPDAATWLTMGAVPSGVTNGSSVSTVTGTGDGTTGNGIYRAASIAGFQQVRVRGATLTAGTLTVNLESSVTTAGMHVTNRMKFQAVQSTALDGSTIDAAGDSQGNTQTRGVDALAGEDNASGLIAVSPKVPANGLYCLTETHQAALVASVVVKATPGVVRSATFRLDSTAPTATYYLQLINAASLPADGAVTLLTMPQKKQHTLGFDDYFVLDFSLSGLKATTGIVVVLSSTEFTKTISGAYLSGSVQSS